MTTFIIRRILISIPVFFGITLLVFMFVALAPGDVADGLHPAGAERRPAGARRDHPTLRAGPADAGPLRQLARPTRSRAAGLPGHERHAHRRRGRRARSRASLILTGTALLLGIFVGIPLGILSAVRQYSKLDFLLTGVTFLGISLPSFLLGLGGLWLLGLQFEDWSRSPA